MNQASLIREKYQLTLKRCLICRKSFSVNLNYLHSSKPYIYEVKRRTTHLPLDNDALAAPAVANAVLIEIDGKHRDRGASYH